MAQCGTKRAINMTDGPLFKNIFLYSLPLMFAQVLEVLFNLSDVAIAGKFADYRALGAVGSTTLLVSLFTGFLIGMGSGVCVRVAHRLGVGAEDGARRTVFSSGVACLVIGLAVFASCALFAVPMLRYHSAPFKRIGAMFASVSTLFNMVGFPKSP